LYHSEAQIGSRKCLEIKKAGERERMVHIKPWECYVDVLMPCFLRAVTIPRDENMQP